MLTLFDGKVCVKCGFWKPFDDYYAAPRSKDKHASWCIECQGAVARAKHRANGGRSREEYRGDATDLGRSCTKCKTWKSRDQFDYAKRHVFHMRAVCKACRRLTEKHDPGYDRAYQEANKERLRQQSHAYYLRNREQVIARSYSYYHSNRRRILARDAAYRKTHRAIDKYYKRRRKQWIEQNGGNFTPQEWIDLCEKYDYRCAACGSDAPLTVDHVVPVSKGGTNDIGNIQPLCMACNQRKSARIIDYR